MYSAKKQTKGEKHELCAQRVENADNGEEFGYSPVVFLTTVAADVGPSSSSAKASYGLFKIVDTGSSQKKEQQSASLPRETIRTPASAVTYCEVGRLTG